MRPRRSGSASRVRVSDRCRSPPETIAVAAYMAPNKPDRMKSFPRFPVATSMRSRHVLPDARAPSITPRPIRWSGCLHHIARKPLLPAHCRSRYPLVSEIIMKLLAKTARSAYQDELASRVIYATGVSPNGSVRVHPSPLRLGEHDAPDRLLLPSCTEGGAR